MLPEPGTVQLQRFEDAQLPELMTWFPDREACTVWGGPGFRFPFSADTFREDTKLDRLSTWALLDDDRALAGFGQYYLRAGRCHLGRLAIAPGMRGLGLGSTLVRELCRVGSADVGVDSYSLFVMPGNERALRLYQRLGFAAVAYPEPAPMFEDCVYMVALRLA
jgi:ribosomal protein S18 acetylase RimI-like enzyme